ncbi:hypothetical protein LEP1GSC061_1396 [Leptospira wolffii serovar Khorat str. Khorat-H2]|nr:hypothetical protein LEP1GSC061_1396 [Leptospira wolffii serovar Khorat str. Khorat-H2]
MRAAPRPDQVVHPFYSNRFLARKSMEILGFSAKLVTRLKTNKVQ